MRIFDHLFRVSTISVFFLWMIGPNSFSQTSSSWRGVPQQTIPRDSDTVAPSVRKTRDDFFDSLIGSNHPLDEPRGQTGLSQSNSTFVWEQVADLPEIPSGPNEIVAEVTFSDFCVRLSHSKRSIYTELDLNLEKLLIPGGVNEGNFQPLTAVLPGGTMVYNSKVLAQGDLTETDTLEPQHRYVVFLEPAAITKLYYITKAWELRDGRVWPLSREDRSRATKGVSRWAGRSEQSFVDAILSSRK